MRDLISLLVTYICTCMSLYVPVPLITTGTQAGSHCPEIGLFL